RPLDVRLLGENQPLSASSEYEVACQSSGARPPANISWWKAGLLLDHIRETPCFLIFSRSHQPELPMTSPTNLFRGA
ncbi:hypothetical protein L9F63_026392, partial [Diploptera punctata]